MQSEGWTALCHRGMRCSLIVLTSENDGVKGLAILRLEDHAPRVASTAHHMNGWTTVFYGNVMV